MLRVCEKLREADAKGRRYGLARAETGYLRALVDATADKDRLLEVELLKSLGDVNLEKGRLGKDVGTFKVALALYLAAVVRCQNKDQGEGIEHRYEYTERLLQGVSLKGSQGKEYPTGDNETTTPTKVAGKFQDLDKRRAAGGNTDSVLVGYAQLMVEGIVNENNMLETEAIKSLGDVYLKRATETRDTRDLTRATALYNTALERCNNVQGTVVIVHRLLHTAKVRQDINTLLTKTKRSVRKQRHQDVTSRKDHLSDVSNGGVRRMATAAGKVTDSSVTTQGDDDSTYEDHLHEGCRALQTGDLDKAEQSLAAALKSVHVKGQHHKEAEPIYKLGDVYLKRGRETKNGGDFTKAAALCNAALVRSRRGDLEVAIQEITQAFVKEVLKIEQEVDIDDTEKHKLMLKTDRDYVEIEIKRIGEEVDPYSLDDNDPKIKEVEMKRVEVIKELFQTLVDQRKTFIAGLVDECMEVMGPPPCKYAMIGLGSQATGLVTAYSDLEFAIFLEEENENNVRYFRNLTHYLHLKVINLGETILPAMGIKSLNDFYSNDPLDNWFYDSVTPRGFSFDGAMPHACKTPLGRGKNNSGTSELIHTPSNMANILKGDLTFHLKKGYHLASILGNVSFITGERGLIDEYRSLWTQKLHENNSTVIVMAKTLVSENASTFQNQALTASLLNVKKEIYRFSSLAVSCLALLYNIQPTEIWETIQELNKSGVVSSENTHHLMVLVSISAELRLRTYINNRGQVENMSALSTLSTDTGIGDRVKKVFYISSTKQLMRYYYTERPLKGFILQLIDSTKIFEDPAVLFDNSSKLKAEVFESLCDFHNLKTCEEQTLHDYLSQYGENPVHYDIAASLYKLGYACRELGETNKAISYYEQSLKMRRSIYGEDTEHPDIAASLNDLGNAWFDLRKGRKAVSYYEQSLQMKRTIYGEDTAHPDIAASLNNLGGAWSELGEHRKAVSYYEQSLQINRTIYGGDTAHPDIAASLNNLGNACGDLGDHRKAVSYHEQSLQMEQVIYGESTTIYNIAASLSNLGSAWGDLGDHRKALSYYEHSLQMEQVIYGEGTSNSKIATSLNNLGYAWGNLGEQRKAVSYYEQSLQMNRSIYGEDTEHPDIANTMINLGAAWSKLGEHRKAVSFFEQSLQMKRSVYGEDTARPDIANTLINLGAAWRKLGEHRKAISYHEQSLQMNRTIHGEETAHPDIATALNNLGNVWNDLGDHREAISYHEQSLQIYLSIYDEDTAHPDIAASLNNLGCVWGSIGDYKKAVSYFELSLQMRRTIYGDDTAHLEIADSLDNLGNAWGRLGDHRKAISHYEQALQMKRSIFGEDTAHPDIAESLYNLCVAWRDLGNYGKAFSYFHLKEQMKQIIGK